MYRKDISMWIVILILVPLFIYSCTHKNEEKRVNFSREILDIISSKYPEVTAEREKRNTPLVIVVKSKGETIKLDLTQIYERFEKEPERKNIIIEKFLSEKLAPLALLKVSSFDEIKNMIMPRVLPKNFFSNMDGLKNCPQEELPHTESLSNTIAIAYVIDYPDRIEYISEKNLKDWDKKPEDIHNIALENLEKKTEKLEPSIMEIPGGKAVIYNSRDGYDSARFLLREKLKGIGGPKSFIVGIPNRDYLIIISGTNKKLISAASKIVKEEFVSNSSPISERLYTVEKTALKEYKAE